MWGTLVALASHSVVFNALITGNFEVLRDALWHLILPCVAVGTIPFYHHCAYDALKSLGSLWFGLYSDSACQRFARARGDLKTCHAQCAIADRNRRRFICRRADERRGADRNRLRVARCWDAIGERDFSAIMRSFRHLQLNIIALSLCSFN